MKSKKIKRIIPLLLLLPLCVVLLGTGCDDKEQDPLCFQGKVVNLNHGDGCQNIIEISEPPENSELPVGATIAFNSDLYDGILNEGDVVYFKVLQYEEFGNHFSTCMLFPEFAASIEFCNN